MYKYFLLFLIAVQKVSSENADCPEIKNITVRGMIRANSDVQFTINDCVNDQLPYDHLTHISILCNRNSKIDRLRSNFIKSFSTLQYILIFYCPLASIEPRTFSNFSSLRSIQIRGTDPGPGTRFVLRKHSFSDLKTLWELDVMLLGVVEIEEETFSNLPVLISLNLSRNKLTYFSEKWFSNNTNKIQYLRLSLNCIKTIEADVFKHFLNLRELDLRNNQINTIASNAFQGVPHLEFVGFSNNKITVLPPDIFESKIVNLTLDLTRNRINYLSENVLNRTLKNGFKLTILNNPIICPCLDYVIKWTNQNKVEEGRFVFKDDSNHPYCVVDLEKPNECEMTVNPRLTKNYERERGFGLERGRSCS